MRSGRSAQRANAGLLPTTTKADRMETLGIFAGGGDLPLAIAESAQEAGRPVFLLGLKGSAGPEIERFPHDCIAMGETGRAFKLLHTPNCGDLLLACRVARPKFSEIKLDAKSVMALPKILNAARKGDDALLRAVVAMFEADGFRMVGVADAAPGLLAKEGVLGKVRPSALHETDIALAAEAVRRLGALDIGQAAVVCEGLVLAVEAAEGTDAMIARVGSLPEAIRGTSAKRRGVLVKALKPAQDRK